MPDKISGIITAEYIRVFGIPRGAKGFFVETRLGNVYLANIIRCCQPDAPVTGPIKPDVIVLPRKLMYPYAVRPAPVGHGIPLVVVGLPRPAQVVECDVEYVGYGGVAVVAGVRARYRAGRAAGAADAWAAHGWAAA